MDYRNEQKYIVSPSQSRAIELLLRRALKPDSNAGGNYGYRVRSLYFDDMRDTAFYENESGVDDRQKIRIRAYDKNFVDLKLEIKSKLNGYTRKERTNIPPDTAKKLIGRIRIPPSLAAGDKVLTKVLLRAMTSTLVPKAIIEYNRLVFTTPVGNVRITIDSNIRYSPDCKRFFRDNILGRPLLAGKKSVLEVKYDDILPGYIEGLLNTGDFNPTPFSKYYLCRLAMKGDTSFDI